MKYFMVGIWILVLVAFEGYAQELDIYGYFEPQYNGLYHKGEYYQFHYNKLRVDLEGTAVKNVKFGADVIYTNYFGKRNWDLLDFLPERIASAVPPDMEPLFQYSYGDTFFLDNAYLRLANNRIALTAGKQQISLGTGYFSNPIDVFNTKDALDPTYEQQGHNAIRLDLMLGHRVSLMGLYFPIEDNWNNSGKFGRTKIGVGHFDFSLIGGELQYVLTDFYTLQKTEQRRRLIGGDIVGQLFGLGIWAEGVYNFLAEDDDFYEFIVGTDYTFAGGLYTLLEYHHNSKAKSDYNEYDLNDWMRLFTGVSKTISRDQMYGLIQYPINDLINIGGSVVFSVSDQSAALVPTVNYNIFANVDLTLMFNLYIGEEGKAFSNKLGNGGFLRGQVYF